MIVAAKSRIDLTALIEVRKVLESGADCTVWFPDATKVQFKPSDLPAVVWKIICNM